MLISTQNKINNYDRWAQSSRIWVQSQVDSRPTDQVSALNASATAGFETLSRRCDAQEEKAKASDVKIVPLEATVNTMAASLADLVNVTQQQRDDPPPAANPPAAAAAAVEQPQEEQEEGAFFLEFRVFAIYSLTTLLSLQLPPLLPPPSPGISE